MNAVIITRAAPVELDICLSLLRPIAGADSVLFTARNAQGRLLGAGGLNWQSHGDLPGFPGWIHVLPDSRRCGVGRALARELVAIAVGEMPAVIAAAPIEDTSPGAAFAAQLGMARVGGRLLFRADGATFLHHMDQIVDRLRRFGHIPATAVCIPLDLAHVGAVTMLMRHELRTVPTALSAMLAQSFTGDPAAAPVDLLRSRMLLITDPALGDQVMGALLTRRDRDGRNAHIIGLVVSPKLRRGWGNALLLAETTRAGVQSACEWFEFDCSQDHANTIGLARRGKADLLRADGLYRYTIAI